MKIYLDYNLFAYLHEGTNQALQAKVSVLSDRHEFPYSPAHMEEIAATLARPSDTPSLDRLASAFCEIDNVSRISRNVQMSPTTLGPMVTKEEQPLDCFLRVMRHYRREPVVEKNDWCMRDFVKKANVCEDISNQMPNLPSDFLANSEDRENLLLELLLRSDLPLICRAHGVSDIYWPTISYHFPVLQRAIELTMGFLDETSYLPEQVRQPRPLRHEVAHSIYASGCEQFITNNKRLYDKVKVSYTYLSIPTEVLMVEDFVSRGYA